MLVQSFISVILNDVNTFFSMYSDVNHMKSQLHLQGIDDV